MSSIAIIQARVGSTRLPGKVLMPIGDYPMIWHVVERVKRAKLVNRVVVATTNKTEDNAIVDMCRFYGWAWFCGDEQDVLDRYYCAASAFKASTVVRVTSDCPLVDSEIIDNTIALHFDSQADYTSNTLEPRTFPRGLDVEVMRFSALERAWYDDDGRLGWREHVTPYIYRHPELFKLVALRGAEVFADFRWTVDTADDLQFVRIVLGAMESTFPTWRDVLAYVLSNPDVSSINGSIVQKTVL